MVNSINSAASGASALQSQPKSANKPQAETPNRQNTEATAPTTKQADTAPSTAETDTRITSLADVNLNTEGAKTAASDIKDALSSLSLSIANQAPDAVQGLLAEAS